MRVWVWVCLRAYTQAQHSALQACCHQGERRAPRLPRPARRDRQRAPPASIEDNEPLRDYEGPTTWQLGPGIGVRSDYDWDNLEAAAAVGDISLSFKLHSYVCDSTCAFSWQYALSYPAERVRRRLPAFPLCPGIWQLRLPHCCHCMGARMTVSRHWLDFVHVCVCVRVVAQVLAPQYGPFIARQLESVDYVALLRRGGEPVSAAAMDCFGSHGCVIDVISTRQNARLQVRVVTCTD